MGLNLAGLGTLLRRGVDDVGSVITGQDWHSAPQTQQQPQAPAPGPQVQSPQQGPQLQVRPVMPQQSGSFNPQLPTSISSSPNIYKATPLPVAIAHPPNLQVGNKVITPGPGGNTNTTFTPSPDLLHQAGNFAYSHAVTPIAQLAQGVASSPTANVVKLGAAAATGNNQAFQNARIGLSHTFNPVNPVPVTVFKDGQNRINPAFSNTVFNNTMGVSEAKPLGNEVPKPTDTAADAAGKPINVSPNEAKPATASKQIKVASSDNGITVKGNYVYAKDTEGSLTKIPKDQWDFNAGLPKEMTAKPEPITAENNPDQYQEMMDNLPRSQKSGIALSQPEAKPLVLDRSGNLVEPKGQKSGQLIKLDQRTKPADTHTISSTDNTPAVKDEIAQYADTFGVTKQQAYEDLKQMQMDKMSLKEIPEGMTPPPTIEERRQIIRDNPKQQETANKIDLGVEDGNVKGAIAKAIYHSEKRDKLINDAALKVNKLSGDDQHLFYQWEDGANIDDLLQHAKDPKRLKTAIETDANAMDYHLALDRASGGSTLRQGNYGLPKYFKMSTEEMDKQGIPENMRFKKGNYTGFHDTSAKYHSYLDAHRRAGLEPFYDNPAEAIMHYKNQGSKVLRDQSLYTALAKAAPDHVGPLDLLSDSNGNRFRQAAGKLPFTASDALQPHLKGFGDSFKTGNKVIDKTADTALMINSKQKAVLFFGAPFHYFNGFSRFVGLTGGSGHLIKLGRGTGESFGSAIIPGVHKLVMEKAERDGVLQYIKENGGIIHDSSRPQSVGGGVLVKMKNAAGTVSPFRLTSQNMGAFFNTMMVNLGRSLKEHGVESGSIEAQQAMAEYNRILGHYNSLVEGGDPTINKLLSGGTLAPHWIRTQFGMIKDAAKYSVPDVAGLGKLGAQGTAKHVIGMYNAGDIARTTLIGTRLAEGAFATIVTAIALGQMPTLKSLVDRFGANPANPVPSVDLGEKDKKGRHQVIDLPTDPTGLAVGLGTDPQHFTQSRFSPALSFGQRLITNKDWNGNPIADPNDPNFKINLVKGAAKGTLPIGAQNFTNPNITTNQGIMQEVGGRVKTDPNDPQVKSQKKYFNQVDQYANDMKSGNFGAIDPSLKNIDPKEAAYWSAQLKSYQDLSPGKDINGVENSREWNALSAQQKASYMLRNEPKTGVQSLSPIFYVQKQLAAQDPSRPHNPLYDLNGNDGVSFTLDNKGNVVGTQNVSRAQIALDYQNQPATSDQKPLILAANPWLSDYEKAVGNFAANYKPNLTQYMQKEGWTQPAIDQYWQQHPNSTPPISNAITPNQQKMLDGYYAITDPTEQSQYFEDNAKELGLAFAADAAYKNQKAVAQGALPDQLHPTPNANAAAGLAQLQKNPNHDKAIGKANALLIQNNPDLNQYLADNSLYGTAKNLAKYQFQDPAHPGLDAGQLLNLGRPIDQSTMSGISNLGKYDIAKDANGKFSFMGAGGTAKFADGSTSGSGGGGSGHYSKNKKIKIFKHYVKPIKIQHAKKSHHTRSTRLKTPNSNLKFNNRSGKTLRIADDSISHVKMG